MLVAVENIWKLRADIDKKYQPIKSIHASIKIFLVKINISMKWIMVQQLNSVFMTANQRENAIIIDKCWKIIALFSEISQIYSIWVKIEIRIKEQVWLLIVLWI